MAWRAIRAAFRILFVVATLLPVCAAGGQDSGAAFASAIERSVSAARPGLDTHGVGAALEALYARSGNRPLWSKDGRATPQAIALLGELGAAEARGLNPADYTPQAPPAAAAALATADAAAAYDVSLSAAALHFVIDLHYGRIDPAKAGFHLEAERPPLDLVTVLENLSTARDVSTSLSALEPQFYHYKLLEQSLKRYRQLAAQQASLPPLPPIPHPPLHPGDSYAGAPALRSLLRLLGDLSGEDPSGEIGTRLDPALTAAVAKFQSRHGLTADGVIGRETFAVLATPLTQRVRQIELTLERWRWLPPFETPPILVNIPQFRLFAFRTTADIKADILQMDVIVGSSYPGKETPVFAADMRYVIFRPYWDVPASITERELLPAIRRDPGYLETQHLEIVQGAEDSASPLPPTEENLAALASGKLRLRQKPGADNALGLVKFMLPNMYNVYLHSTPAHRLFAESRRDFSHGCIRVSDPVVFAVHVLRETPGEWTAEKVQAAMAGADAQRVNLAQPIHVMILYATVLATESGDVLFFDDIYGHDKKLEALLHHASSVARAASAR